MMNMDIHDQLPNIKRVREAVRELPGLKDFLEGVHKQTPLAPAGSFPFECDDFDF